MKPTPSKILAASIAALLFLPAALQAAPPTLASQQAEIEELKKANAMLAAQLKTTQSDVAAMKKAVASAPAAKPAAAPSTPGVAKASAGKGKKETALEKEVSQDNDIERDSLTSDGPSLRERSQFFATPESPAATVLGVAPKQIIHADTAKQLIGSALSGMDERGHFQSGLAIDFVPAQLFKTKRIGINRPVEERAGLMRFGDAEAALTYARTVLDRTQISFATVRGTEKEDKSLKLALGIHAVLLDADDPTLRLASEKAGDGLAHPAISPPGIKARESMTTGWLKDLNRRFEDDRKDVFPGDGWFPGVERFFYEHASWSVGAAPVWISQDGTGSNYEYNGTTAWSTFTLSGDPQRKMPVRYLLHLRYRDSEQVPGEESLLPLPVVAGVDAPKFVKQDSLLAILGLRVGTSDLNATVSAAYLKAWQGSVTDDAFRYSVQGEVRVSENSFLTLSVGREMGHSDRKDETLVLGGVRLGLGGTDFTRKDRGIKAKEIRGSSAE